VTDFVCSTVERFWNPSSDVVAAVNRLLQRRMTALPFVAWHGDDQATLDCMSGDLLHAQVVTLPRDKVGCARRTGRRC